LTTFGKKVAKMGYTKDKEQESVAKPEGLREKALEHEKPDLAEFKKEKLKEFERHVKTAGRGIFTTKTRKRLSGTLGLSGRDRTKKDFWFDRRKEVKAALVDLQLFIEAADEDQANQVINRDALEPIVSALFQEPAALGLVDPSQKLEHPQLYLERAKIAQLFIQRGFEYLGNMNLSVMTLSHKRTFDEALDLGEFLLRNSPVGIKESIDRINQWPKIAEQTKKTKKTDPHFLLRARALLKSS
jgi:hypothetical protein